ncbi:MAG: hypothetical protein HC927_03585 [Deltaproteobacteria bacterium]|nr:hypothetical protein [Deltaproteobacteria bacterium]
MTDAIIDTNVLLTSSHADPDSPFDGTDHLTAEQCLQVMNWLLDFVASDAHIVFDEDFKIYEEYRNKMSDQDLGLIAIHRKLESELLRTHIIDYDTSGFATVPDAFAQLDRSDRKFLAVAIKDLETGHESEIINATDTDDWQKIAVPCTEHGIAIRHLLEE